MFTVSYGNGVDHDVENLLEDEPASSQFVLTNHVLMNHITQSCFLAATEATGYMIIDTACQRSCCGLEWYHEHARHLGTFHLHPFEMSKEEIFQFGSGSPLKSKTLAMLPSAFEGAICLVLGSYILETSIPFLGSLATMNKLRAVIDLPQQVVFLSKFDMSVPLAVVGRHLATKITQFPPKPERLAVWAKITEVGFLDPEVNLPPSVVQIAQARRDVTLLDRILPDAPGGTTAPSGSMAPTGGETPRDNPPGRADTSHGIETQHRGHREGAGRGQGDLQVGSSHQSCRKDQTKDEGYELEGGCHRVQTAADGRVQPPDVQKARKSPRQFRNMPNVPGQMEVGGRRMEVAWWLIQLLATAAIVQATASNAVPIHDRLLHAVPCPSSGSSIITDALSTAGKTVGGPGSHHNTGNTFTTGTTLAPPQAIRIMEVDKETWTRARPVSLTSSVAGHGLQPDEIQDYDEEMVNRNMEIPVPSGAFTMSDGSFYRLGEGKDWLETSTKRSNINKAVYMLESEIGAINNLAGDMGKDFNIDLMELFAGTSKPTSMARRFGLTALQPFEIEDGRDLASKAIQKTVDFALNKFKPLLLMVGFPCTLLCIMNENLNYSSRMEELWGRTLGAARTSETFAEMGPQQTRTTAQAGTPHPARESSPQPTHQRPQPLHRQVRWRLLRSSGQQGQHDHQDLQADHQ